MRMHSAAAAAAFLSLALARPVAAEPPGTPPPLDRANLDPKTSPADDFYQYANGGWMAKNPVPAEFSTWGAFSELNERNNASLRKILEKAMMTKYADGSDEKKVADFYASGMDEKAIEAAGAKPLDAEFARIEAVADLPGLTDEIAHLHGYGIGALFGFYAGSDDKNSEMVITQIFQGGLGLPDRDYYTKDDPKSAETRQQYLEHVEKMFALLGDAPEVAKANAATVMRIETALAKPSMTRVEQRDPNAVYHKMPLAELQKLTPDWDWQHYFSTLGVEDPGDLNVAQPEFFKAAMKLAAETSIPDWKTYLRWHVIDATAENLSSPFVEENFRFGGTILQGTKKLKERWKRMVDATNGALGEPLGKLYVAEYFTPEAKARALEMVKNIKVALSERISSLEWMDAPTKAEAQKKLSAFTVKIGYPDKWRDYSTLKIDRSSFAENALNSAHFEMLRNIAKIGKPVDRTEWGMTPPTVNAYYNPNLNEIVFPAGILQPPFFDAKADDAVNYGGMGAVIGHEMTHGFDDQGRQYDAAGNLKEWWSEDSAARFKERSGAIVKQFADYVAIDDLKVNGELTQGENIADLGGVKVAFAALQKALAKNPAGKIDGWTPEQRYFLSWAQVWRANVRPEAVRLRANTDPHSPPKFRTNGSLGNVDEFAKAFGLPADAKMMRPEAERVHIW